MAPPVMLLFSSPSSKSARQTRDYHPMTGASRQFVDNVSAYFEIFGNFYPSSPRISVPAPFSSLSRIVEHTNSAPLSLALSRTAHISSRADVWGFNSSSGLTRLPWSHCSPRVVWLMAYFGTIPRDVCAPRKRIRGVAQTSCEFGWNPMSD